MNLIHSSTSGRIFITGWGNVKESPTSYHGGTGSVGDTRMDYQDAGGEYSTKYQGDPGRVKLLPLM